MNIAAQLRGKVTALPAGWADRLAHRLKELAELAEIHPICHAREAPITMQMVVDRLQVEYEVDRDRRLLTVTALSERVPGRDEDPGSSGAL